MNRAAPRARTSRPAPAGRPRPSTGTSAGVRAALPTTLALIGTLLLPALALAQARPTTTLPPRTTSPQPVAANCPVPGPYLTCPTARAEDLAPAPAQSIPGPGFRTPSLRLGFSLDRSTFPNFASVVGDQADILTFASERSTQGLGAMAEWRARAPWILGANVRLGEHTFEQTFAPTDGSTPTRVTGTVSALFADAYVGYSIPFGLPRDSSARRATPASSAFFPPIFPGSFDALFGPVWARNVGDFLWDFGDELQSGTRTHDGFMFRFGLGLTWDFGWGFGLRGGFDYLTSFKPKDADTHTRVSIGLTHTWYHAPPSTPIPAPPGPSRPRPPQPPAPPGGDSSRTPPIPAPPTPPTPTPPPPPPTPTPPQESGPICCGRRGQYIVYPKGTDPRSAPAVQAAPWAIAATGSQVLMPNGAYFHNEKDLQVESVGFPFTWSRHYISDFPTTAGGAIGHRWDYNMDKRILPVGGTPIDSGLMREVLGVFQPRLYYHNGQGRVELYTTRRQDYRQNIINFGTTFSAYVTVYQSPPGAFHEIERYVVDDPLRHPFRTHPNVDAAHGESIFFVLREKNGLRYVFNCRGQLIHILSRHDWTSLGPTQERDSVRVSLYYGAPINPLTQNPVLQRIVDTADRTYTFEWDPIGRSTLDTNLECVWLRGPRDIPRLTKVTGGGTVVEYVYSGREPTLDTVRVTTGAIVTATAYRYDGQRRLLTVTPPKGVAVMGRPVIENRYDGSGRVERQRLGDGLLTWNIGYQGAGQVIAVNKAGDRHDFALTQVGGFWVVASETHRSADPEDGGPWTTRYTHNTATQVTSMTLPRGNVVRYEYDTSNDPVTLGPLRDFVTMTYDSDLSLGNLLSVRTESGALPGPPRQVGDRFEFEPLFNQLLLEVDGNGNESRYEYRYDRKGNFGNPVTVSGPTLTQPDGARLDLTPLRYTYDIKGQVQTIDDRRGGVTSYTYGHPRHYATRISYPGGAFRTYSVDDYGRILEEGGSFGTTRFLRDDRGRDTLRVVVGGAFAQHRVTTDYDLHGNATRTATSVTDDFDLQAVGDSLMAYDRASGGRGYVPRGLARMDDAELVATTTFDALDRPVVERTAAVERRLTYDERGFLRESTYPSPTGTGLATTTFRHDARGLLRERTPGLENESAVRYGYDANGNRAWMQTGPDDSRQTRYEYDAFDRLQRTVDPLGTITELALDANGNVLDETVTGATLEVGGPQSVLARTGTRYNELDKPIVVRRYLLAGTSDAEEGRLFYNAAGDVARAVAANGSQTRFTYDDAGRVTELRAPELRTVHAYDEVGRTLSTTEFETDRRYDHATARLREVEAGHETTFSYDNFGRLARQSGPAGTVTRLYNSMGQVRLLTEEGHGTTETRYDILGRTVSVEKGGAFQRFTWLASGHLEREESNGASRSYAYDALGRRTRVTDRRLDATTTSEWNDFGDEHLTRDANGTVQAREFNAAGLPTRVDITHGRVASLTSPTTPGLSGPTWEAYTYDGLGRVIRTWTSQELYTQFAYDGLGNILADHQERNGEEHVVTYRYAADQSSVEVRYPAALGGAVVRRTMDRAGRVARVDVDGQLAAEYVHTGVDRLATRTYANGVITSWAYDPGRRLTNVAVSAPGGTSPRNLLWTGALTWAGPRIARVEEARYRARGALALRTETSYAYDAAGRRIAGRSTNRSYAPGASTPTVTLSGTATRYGQGGVPVAVVEYALENGGDRVAMARVDQFQFDSAGRQASGSATAVVDGSVGWLAATDVDSMLRVAQRGSGTVTDRQAYEYDRVGNLIADGSRVYSYDHKNRLTRVAEYRSVQRQDEAVLFIYDALGRRVQQTPTRTQTPAGLLTWATWAREGTRFLYSGSQVIGELVAIGGSPMLARYFGGASPAERIRMDRRRGDDPAAPMETWYLHDGVQGSIAMVTDAARTARFVGWDGAASAGAPFRPPDDLHVIDGTRTRQPYLSGSLRVDAFAGVHHDEATGEVAYDYRAFGGLASQVDMQAVRDQVHAAQATGLAALAGMAAAAIGAVTAPTAAVAVWEAGLSRALSFAAFGGLMGTGIGYAGAWWNGTDYTLGQAAGDFAEGAVLGVLGGAMAAAQAGLLTIAAVDYSAGYFAGGVRGMVSGEGFEGAMMRGTMNGAIGAIGGLGMGVVAKWWRGDYAALADPDLVRIVGKVPEPTGLAKVASLNARWQRYAPSAPLFDDAWEDVAVGAEQKLLEQQVLSYMLRGPRISRIVARLIMSGELKVFFREEALLDGRLGYFVHGSDYVVVNVLQGPFKTGNLPRQIAAVLTHEGTHFLGGGEPAAFIAEAQFLMRTSPQRWIQGAGYTGARELQSEWRDVVRAGRLGISRVGRYIDEAVAGGGYHPSDILIPQPLHKAIQNEGGFARVLGLSKRDHATLVAEMVFKYSPHRKGHW